MEKSNAKFAAFALALLALAAVSSASVNPKVQLLNYTLSEVPAQPGHTLALTLFFKSMESDNCAERMAVSLSVSYPLSIRGSDTQYVESLCFRDPDSKGTLTFHLPVDNLATSGTYPVSVATSYEKRFTKLSESNTVNVQVGGAPSLSGSITSSTPVDIYPGDTAKVTLTIQNSGSSMVRSSTATAYSSGVVVKWAGQTQELGQISARGSADAVFTVEAPKDLRSGAYPLNVRLDYTSENRSKGSTEFRFEIPVKKKADFSATPHDGDLLPGVRRDVIITLNNTGTDEARKLKVRLKPIFPFSTDGTVRYVESLPAGQSANLTYTITVDKDATSGAQALGFIVEFEDPQGRQFTKNADFALGVRMPTLAEEALSYWYVWAALALCALYFLFGRKKKPAAA